MSNNEITKNKDAQIKAAYALNLCTVSVSQIIDYNDLNILEQEYEAILNNLNLEQIPKDEALLNILKQLLETITFFRIEEGDKKMIDKEYQQKIKNAIWNAVPNFGMIVAGGSPITMAISLASQVGIGYMNYRKQKAEIGLDYEKQKWQLQRSAMEQFNALRRELFDTAWRLSDTYKFEDNLRLTERQIKQYDTILMDTDPIRRYERLDAIKENFIAYPPFWYYIGSAANEISNINDPRFDDDFKSQYKNLAISYFEKFEEVNKYDILREDQLASSCALEHIDLLDPVKDKEKILHLLERAINKSGYTCDVLQLCAIDYLKIGEPFKAVPLFKYLSNENYNRITNAQFLSSLYVFDYAKNGNIEAKNGYKLLESRVRPEYLYPFPSRESENNKALNDKYISTQREIVKYQYEQFFSLLKSKYEIKFNRIIPAAKKKNIDNDAYFTDEMTCKRLDNVRSLSEKKGKWNEYIYQLSQVELVDEYLELFNSLYDSVCAINIFINKNQKMNLKVDIDMGIRTAITTWIYTQKNLTDDTYDYSIGDFERLLECSFTKITKDFFEELNSYIDEIIALKTTVNEFTNMQNELSIACEREQFPSPEILLDKHFEKNELVVVSNDSFELNHYLNGALKKEIEMQDTIKKMKQCIESFIESIATDSNKCEIFVGNTANGKKGFQRYFAKKPFTNVDVTKQAKAKRKSEQIDVYKIKQEAIAVLNDKTKNNFDIVFTDKGVYPIISQKVKSFVEYNSIQLSESNKDCIKFGEVNKDNDDSYDIFALMDLFEKLNDYSTDFNS